MTSRWRVVTLSMLGVVVAAGAIAATVVLGWRAAYSAGPLAEEIRTFRPPALFAAARTTYDQEDGPCLTTPCPSAGVDFGPVEVADPAAAAHAVLRHLEAEGFLNVEQDLSEWACYEQGETGANLRCSGDFFHPDREHIHYVIMEATRTRAELSVWVEAP